MLRDSYWVRTVTQFHCHDLGNTHSEASSDILQSRLSSSSKHLCQHLVICDFSIS